MAARQGGAIKYLPSVGKLGCPEILRTGRRIGKIERPERQIEPEGYKLVLWSQGDTMASFYW